MTSRHFISGKYTFSFKQIILELAAILYCIFVQVNHASCLMNRKHQMELSFYFMDGEEESVINA